MSTTPREGGSYSDNLDMHEGKLLELHRDIFYGLSAVQGDNPISNSITDHGVVDADALKHEMDAPATFSDPRAQSSDPKEKAAYIEELLDKVTELRGHIYSFPEDRRGVLMREADQVEVMLRTDLADVTGQDAPSFADRWKAVTGKEPGAEVPRDEVDDIRGEVLSWIAKDGINVTNPKKSASEIVNEWRAGHEHFGNHEKGVSNPAQEEKIRTILNEQVGAFVQDAVAELSKRIPGLKKLIDSSGVSFEGLKFNVLPDMNFDAGLSYIGGVKESGVPSGAANFEWNAGRPDSKEGIIYIAAHEATHWLNAFFMDIMRRAGKLGPESAILTMSTGRTANEEGLAQTMMEMLHNGDMNEVARKHGVSMVVENYLDRLQDMVRMHVALEWNVQKRQNLDALGAEIQERFLQTPHIAYKYAGEKKRFWRQIPTGTMYAPAYYEGSRAMRSAYQEHGVDRALAVATHTEGLVDLQAFKDKVARPAESLLIEQK